MKKRWKLAAVLLPAILLLALLPRLSDNSGMAPRVREEKPYYVPERAVVARLGGLGLTLEEFRYHAAMALLEDLGRSPLLADLYYDEALAARVKELALARAARWRALTVMAMEAGIDTPEPDPNAVEALSREPWCTRAAAASLVRADTLSSLLYAERYGVSGERLTPEEILAWGEGNGILRVRALFLSTDPLVYSPTEAEGRLEQARIFAAQLRAGEAGFDDLCAAYGEDERWAAGRQLAPDCGREDIYAPASALEPGGCAALKLEDGVYLILRCPLLPEETTETGDGRESLRTLAAAGLFRQELAQTAAGLDTEFTQEWKKLRMDLLFRERSGEGEAKKNGI